MSIVIAALFGDAAMVATDTLARCADRDAGPVRQNKLYPLAWQRCVLAGRGVGEVIERVASDCGRSGLALERLLTRLPEIVAEAAGDARERIERLRERFPEIEPQTEIFLAGWDAGPVLRAFRLPEPGDRVETIAAGNEPPAPQYFLAPWPEALGPAPDLRDLTDPAKIMAAARKQVSAMNQHHRTIAAGGTLVSALVRAQGIVIEQLGEIGVEQS